MSLAAASLQWLDSLVVEHDVRSPDVVAGNVKLGHTTVFFRVPFQLVVPPELKY